MGQPGVQRTQSEHLRCGRRHGSCKDVISTYQGLSANDIQIWLTGGWGIDALLREQTRPHKDLDLIMLVDDVVRMRDFLGRPTHAAGACDESALRVQCTDGDRGNVPTERA